MPCVSSPGCLGVLTFSGGAVFTNAVSMHRSSACVIRHLPLPEGDSRLPSLWIAINPCADLCMLDSVGKDGSPEKVRTPEATWVTTRRA